MIIKRSLIDSTWVLEILDSGNAVLSTHTGRGKWLENFTDAIDKGADSPLGDWGYDAIKFGNGETSTVSGMDGIESVISLNGPVWPKVMPANIANSISYNGTTREYTKTSVETHTININSSSVLLPGTVITEIGAAFDYSFRTTSYYVDDQWTDDVGAVLGSKYVSGLYENIKDSPNPLCAWRSLITDSNNIITPITLVDGQKLKLTITTIVESALPLDVVIDTSVSGSETLVETQASLVHTLPTALTSYLGKAPFGPAVSASWITGYKISSSSAETYSGTLDWVFDTFRKQWRFLDRSNISTSGFETTGLSDIQSIVIDDAGAVGAGSPLSMCQISFNPPIPVESPKLDCDLSMSVFVEPKYVTTPGVLSYQFIADPTVMLFSTWAATIQSDIFKGMNLDIVTSAPARSVAVVYNGVAFYPGAVATGGNQAPLEFYISGVSGSGLTITGFNSESDATSGFYSDLKTGGYLIRTDGSETATVTIGVRDRDNRNNFVEKNLVLDVSRPVFNASLNNPLLLVSVPSGLTDGFEPAPDLHEIDLVTGAINVASNLPNEPRLAIYSRSGNFIAVSFGAYFQVFTSNWQFVNSMSGDFVTINSIDWSPDNSKLAIGHEGGVTVYNTSNWSVVPGVPVITPVNAVKFNPAGTALVVATRAANGISVLSTSTWELIPSSAAMTSAITELEFSADGVWLAATNSTNGISIIDGSTWAHIYVNVIMGGVNPKFTPNGSYIVFKHIDGADQNGVYIHQTSNWQNYGGATMPGDISKIDISPDGATIAVMCNGGNNLVLLNASTLQITQSNAWIRTVRGDQAHSLMFKP